MGYNCDISEVVFKIFTYAFVFINSAGQSVSDIKPYWVEFVFGCKGEKGKRGTPHFSSTSCLFFSTCFDSEKYRSLVACGGANKLGLLSLLKSYYNASTGAQELSWVSPTLILSKEDVQPPIKVLGCSLSTNGAFTTTKSKIRSFRSWCFHQPRHINESPPTLLRLTEWLLQSHLWPSLWTRSS